MSADAVQRRVVGQVLQQGQIAVQAATLEHDAELLQGGRGAPPHVMA
jgi:hypothetical protein